MNLGYCCINLTLQKSKGIMTNRGMIRKTFLERGTRYASEISLQNVKHLYEIVKWNASNKIQLFRVSSCMFPWMSEYELSELKDYEEISNTLLQIGKIAEENSQRIVMHPGHFNVLSSKNQKVVENSIKDLNQHSEILDMMGFNASHNNVLNIHVNLSTGDKSEIFKRFIENFNRLDDNCKNRLTLENDDVKNQWSTLQLIEYSNKMNFNIPIVFDYHHHRCHSDGLDEYEALKLASTSWKNQKQLCHYSSCRQIENPDAKMIAHANLIYEKIEDYDLDLDVELEAKHKELALFNYQQKFTLNK